MPNFDTILGAGSAAALEANSGQVGTSGDQNAYSRLVDTGLATTDSIGREAQFVAGSITSAAGDAFNTSTALGAAQAIATGVVFTALESRYCLPGLVRQAATAVVAANLVADAADYKKWGLTLSAATDVWHSGKNIDQDIEIGRQSLGRAVVGNLVLASGLLLGGRLGGSFLPRARPFASTQFSSRQFTPTFGKFFQETLPDAALPNLSRPAQGEPFRYFAQARSGTEPDIYRWPANGKPLKEQLLEEVERFDLSGTRTWKSNARQALMRERSKGWFNESTDEISVDHARSLIERMLKARSVD